MIATERVMRGRDRSLHTVLRRLDSGQLLLICAAGLVALTGVAYTAAEGLDRPEIAVGFGAATLLGELPFEVPYAAVLGWVVVDGLAFSALACLDACLHLENRMRVEGLDLALATATGSRRSVLAAIP